MQLALLNSVQNNQFWKAIASRNKIDLGHDVYAKSTATTASVATSTTALDTWYHQKDRNDRQTFDGGNLPYSNFPRKSDTATS